MVVEKVERINQEINSKSPFGPLITSKTLLQVNPGEITLSGSNTHKRLVSLVKALAPDYVNETSCYGGETYICCTPFHMYTFFPENKTYSDCEVVIFRRRVSSLNKKLANQPELGTGMDWLTFSDVGSEAVPQEEWEGEGTNFYINKKSLTFPLRRPLSLMWDAKIHFYSSLDKKDGRITTVTPDDNGMPSFKFVVDEMNHNICISMYERLITTLIKGEDPFQGGTSLLTDVSVLSPHYGLTIFNPTIARLERAGGLFREFGSYLKNHANKFKPVIQKMYLIDRVCELMSQCHSSYLNAALKKEKSEVRERIKDMPPFLHAKELSDLV